MKLYRPNTLQITVIILSIILFSRINSYSQEDCNYYPPQQAENWVFGNNSLINFSGGDANAEVTSRAVRIPSGVSAISNSSGELQFISDGLTAKNSAFANITNGDNLDGNNLATQSSIIVPQPDDERRYFLFTMDMYIPPVFTKGVNYSVVEFRSGIPNVVSANNFLMTENAQKIAAVSHANGTDYWVVVHGFGSAKGKEFYSYLVSASGVSDTPVVTNIGHPHEGDFSSNNGAGSMKISPDGSKLALAIPDDGVVEVYDFDTETGKLSNLKTSAISQFVMAFGIEFSPDNSKLYFSITPKDLITNYIYQVDLNHPDPFAAPYIVHQFDVSPVGGSADSLLGALQLAPDGKIYAAKFRKGITEKDYLGVIYNPNRPGELCNYNYLNHASNNGLYLNGGNSLMGLPNFVSTFLDIPHFYYQNQCFKDTVRFTIRNTANIDNVNWNNFGDPDGTQVSVSPSVYEFIYSEPGDYQLNMSEIYDGINGPEEYNYTGNITINPLPDVVLADGAETLYIMENSSVVLDAGEWDSYEWQPGGSTEQYLEVVEEGVYSVTVTNEDCCTNTDDITVVYGKINFPNAFKPSSTITDNSEFKMVSDISGFKTYKLNIFNRWGQLIFETEDPTAGWNGTYEGQDSPMGTYVYSAYFESYETSSLASVQETIRGTVTLIR